jgi:hypothetical protein
MKLSELVTVRREECQVCLSFIYTLPCNTDKRLALSLRVFGKEKYPLGIIELFKIETEQFFVEFSLGTKRVKIWMKKELGPELDVLVQKLESCLIEWLSDVYDSDIEKG